MLYSNNSILYFPINFYLIKIPITYEQISERIPLYFTDLEGSNLGDTIPLYVSIHLLKSKIATPERFLLQRYATPPSSMSSQSQ